MIKKYLSYTNLSINVVLPNNRNVRISFTPHSNGDSSFVTNDDLLQECIEKHHSFGKLFRLVEEKEDRSESSTSNVVEEEPEVKTVHVTDFAIARDYIADNYGVSRTSLRSMKSILDFAEAHGIVFEGLS